MKTHKVLDLAYTIDEGQDCFVGTFEECQNFVQEQGSATFMFNIVPLSKQEIIFENNG